MTNEQFNASLENRTIEFEYKGIKRVVHLITKPNSQKRKCGNRDKVFIENNGKVFLAGKEIYKDGMPIDAWKVYDLNMISNFRIIN